MILDGAEGMLNLIASLQGRRMEEQRAHLNVASDTESLISSVATTEGKDDQIRLVFFGSFFSFFC